MNTSTAMAHTRPLNILLAEDDDGDAKGIQRAFRKAKIANRVLRAVDGIEALDMLNGTNGKEKAPTPCILLVDLNMPRMNGIQFIQALRRNVELRQLIAFVITTSKRKEDMVAAYDLNVAGYILKETAGHDCRNLIQLMDWYWRVVEMP
jgi:CheY-like chemotaxis protein